MRINHSFLSFLSMLIFVRLSGVQNSGFPKAMLLPSNSYAFSVQKLCFYNPKAMLLKNG